MGNLQDKQLSPGLVEDKDMRYVYILRSTSHPGQRYVGITSDLKQRLVDHNNGKNVHTAKFRPRRVETYVGFSDEVKAIAFERYLKTGSGRRFRRRDCERIADMVSLRQGFG